MAKDELTLEAIMAKDFATMKTIDEDAPEEQKESEVVNQVVKFDEPEFRGKRDAKGRSREEGKNSDKIGILGVFSGPQNSDGNSD